MPRGRRRLASSARRKVSRAKAHQPPPCEAASECTQLARLRAQPADLNYAENGVTPLVALCGAHDWPQIVSLMLELGAEIDDDNNSGHTAMMLASDKGHRRSVAVLKCAVMEQAARAAAASSATDEEEEAKLCE